MRILGTTFQEECNNQHKKKTVKIKNVLRLQFEFHLNNNKLNKTFSYLTLSILMSNQILIINNSRRLN